MLTIQKHKLPMTSYKQYLSFLKQKGQPKMEPVDAITLMKESMDPEEFEAGATHVFVVMGASVSITLINANSIPVGGTAKPLKCEHFDKC